MLVSLHEAGRLTRPSLLHDPSSLKSSSSLHPCFTLSKPSAHSQTLPAPASFANMSAATASSLTSREAVAPERVGARSSRPALARPCSSTLPCRRRLQQRPSALAGGFLTASEPAAAGLVVQAASAVAWTGVVYLATRLFFQQQVRPQATATASASLLILLKRGLRFQWSGRAPAAVAGRLLQLLDWECFLPLCFVHGCNQPSGHGNNHSP